MPAWTPNDITLSVDAYIRWQTHSDDEEDIVATLAQETNRDRTAARAGMMAVGNVDPEVAHGPALTPFAQVIAEHLWNDRVELRRLVRVVRQRLHG